MNHERVSIVMCTCNGEPFLAEQLDSIIGQTYPIYELIIQDDCSDDKTVDIIHAYCRKHPFIKLHVNEHRLGYNRNFLSALLKATGDAIAIADQDDIWDREKIEKQVGKLNEGYSLVFHNSFLFEKSADEVISKRHPQVPLISELRLLMKPFIPGHECLFSRAALPRLKELYEKEPNLAYAYVLALVCETLDGIAYLDEGLVYWRRHPQAATRKNATKTYGAIEGMMQSLRALFQTRKRTIPRRYFSAIGILPFRTSIARKVLPRMQGGTWQLILACLLCGSHAKALYRKRSLHTTIKATFTPLHLIRDAAFLLK